MKEKDFEALRQRVIRSITTYLDRHVPPGHPEERGLFSVELSLEVDKVFDKFQKKAVG